MEFTASIRPDRVAIYARWSTDEQSQGTTLEVQRTACEAYIASQGWHVRPDLVFVDDGYSGATLDRPALTELRAAVREGRVECVVVYTLDRLSRSVADTVELVLKEWEGRCHLRCVQQPIDTAHPAGKMFFYLLASYAEFEREMIRLRTRDGKAKRARQGANAGWRYNYGFDRRERGRFVVNEEEAHVVRWIFREYARGKGFLQIARELNERHVPPPEGTRWHPGTVRYILANPVYTGRLVYGKRRRAVKGGRAALEDPKPETHTVVHDAVPALVDPQLWADVQQKKADRSKRSAKSMSPTSHLLSGLAVCGFCGGRIFGTSSKGKRRVYYCANRAVHGKDCCPSGYMDGERVERAVWERLEQALGDEAVQEVVQAFADRRREELETVQSRVAMLTSRLNAFGRVEWRLDEAFDAGALDPELYSRRVRELQGQIRALRDEISRLSQQADALGKTRPDAERIRALAYGVIHHEPLSVEEKKEVLREAVAELKIAQEGSGSGRRQVHPLRIHLTIRCAGGNRVSGAGTSDLGSRAGRNG